MLSRPSVHVGGGIKAVVRGSMATVTMITLGDVVEAEDFESPEDAADTAAVEDGLFLFVEDAKTVTVV